MRITAAIAALALALASGGCATCAMATLASFDPHGHDDGPLLVTGTVIDGIAMTSLGAGALDGHSSVGWSRTEGEWAMAGGITLLVIDAVVIAVEVASESREEPAPLGPPPPGKVWVTIHAEERYEYARLVHFEPGPEGTLFDERLGDDALAVAPGRYRLCVRYVHDDYGRDPRITPASYIACADVRIDARHREITMPSPDDAPVTAPR